MSFVVLAIAGTAVSAAGTVASVVNASKARDQTEQQMAEQDKVNAKALQDKNNQIATNQGNAMRDAQLAMAQGNSMAGGGRQGTILTSPLAAGAPAQGTNSGKTVLGI